MRRMLIGSLLLMSQVAGAAPLGTAFTYQGFLKSAGQPATGLYDFQVCLFDQAVNPVPLQCAPDFDDVPVEDGVFSLLIDFGSAAFAGEANYVELRVRDGSGGAYVILTPRQIVRPAPEALRAAVSSAAPWSGLSGVPAGFADNVDDDTNSGGTVTRIESGAGLAGGPISSVGTLSIANGGVNEAMIAPAAVGPLQLQTGAVDNDRLDDNAVSLSKIATNSVNSVRIVDGSVAGIDIASGAIGLTQINAAEVQARVTTTCPAGQYSRSVGVDGVLACEPLPGLRVTSTLDAGAANVGTFNDILLLSDGRPAMSYYDSTNGNLKFVVCANVFCTGSPVITTIDNSANNVGQFSSAALGADGFPVIAYYDTTTDDLKVLKCGNATCTSGNVINTVDSTGNVGQLSAIALGQDGNPVVAYLQQTGTFDFEGLFKIAKCANPACSGAATITTVDNLGTGNFSSSVSIVVPIDGLPVIAYQAGSVASTGDALIVVKCINANCTGTATRTVIHSDIEYNLGAHASLAVDSANRPVIAYMAINGQLGIARCLNASCTSSDREQVPGFAVDLLDAAFGDDGIPVISAHVTASDDLLFTRCLSSDCSQTFAGGTFVTQVAVDGQGGAHTSMVIGADGLPVIAFEDGGDLRVVKCGDRSCH